MYSPAQYRCPVNGYWVNALDKLIPTIIFKELKMKQYFQPEG